MTKTFSFLFIILLFISCGKSGGSGSSSSGDSVTLSEVTTSSPVPSAALNFDVNLKLENLNAQQEDKLNLAADKIKKVIASEGFKNAILNFTYNGKKTFVDNLGLSNAQVYKKIIEGSEKLNPGVDNTMDLEVQVYSASTNVVGYTLPNVVKIWMNLKYLNATSASGATTNMVHEWLHKLGFGHAQTSNPSRPYSVPYAVGYLVGRLAKGV